MSKFGTKQTATTATTTTTTATATTMPKEISGIPVVTETTTIGVNGDMFANFIHANDHHVKVHNLPVDMDERIEHLKKMLVIFPAAKIEVVTVTR